MSDEVRVLFEEPLVFNGINAVTGDYGQAPMSPHRLARLIRGIPSPEDYRGFLERQRQLATLTQLEGRLARVGSVELSVQESEEVAALEELIFKARTQAPYPVKPGGGDPSRVEEVGWAVVFPAEMHPRVREEIKEALQPLLDLRHEQAGDLFQLYEGGDAYRPGERKDQYLERLGVGPGLTDPQEMPFYVMLVGTPEEIPYSFQYQLDVMRGVGRLDFGSDIEAYAAYALHVVACETGAVTLPRRAAFFAPANSGDRATKLSAQYLMRPLYENLSLRAPERELPLAHDWELAAPYVGEGLATHEQLGRLLGGDPTEMPALLFTAGHGIEFPAGHSAQLRHQGALLCQDWPGLGRELRRDHYFAGEDVAEGASLLGMMAFIFACYGAGTPQLDQFAVQAFKVREKIAERGFTAALPQQMLKQGALAVFGHVERAWGYSFISPTGRLANQSFVTSMRMLMNGEPIGLASDVSFNMRYAELSSDLNADLEELKWDPEHMDDYELVHRWTANNDARGYIVLGDPAARIPFERDLSSPKTAPIADGETFVVPDLLQGPELARELATPFVESDDVVPRYSAAIPPVPEARAESSAWDTAPLTPQAAEPGGMAELTAAEAAVAFGLKDQFERLRESLRSFTDQLATSLGHAAEDIVTLDVRTYSTKNIARVAAGLEAREEVDATLRALTRVAFNGDLKAYVPERPDGEVDAALWEVHRSMVEEAQQSRARFLATMAELATRLLESLRIGS
jgi:hypothetical protein